jgi:hypothetical protein
LDVTSGELAGGFESLVSGLRSVREKRRPGGGYIGRGRPAARGGGEAKCGKVLVRRERVAPGGQSAELAFGLAGIRSFES